MKGILFQIGIVEAAEDITETESLWNSFQLLKLLLIEGDVVILSNVANRREQVLLQVFLSLFLLHNHRPFQVEVVFFAQDIVQRRILASVNADFMKFVPKVIFDWLLLESLSFKYNIILSFEHYATKNVVFLLQQIRPLQKLHHLVAVNIVVTLFNIHGHKVQFWLSSFSPFIDKNFIFLHDVIIVEYSKSKFILKHFSFQVLQHHVWN